MTIGCLLFLPSLYEGLVLCLQLELYPLLLSKTCSGCDLLNNPASLPILAIYFCFYLSIYCSRVHLYACTYGHAHCNENNGMHSHFNRGYMVIMITSSKQGFIWVLQAAFRYCGQIIDFGMLILFSKASH